MVFLLNIDGGVFYLKVLHYLRDLKLIGSNAQKKPPSLYRDDGFIKF